MAGRKHRRYGFALGSLAMALCLGNCARWPGGPPSGVVSPKYASFDDLLPAGITSFVYLHDLPASKERFEDTFLAQRFRDQEARGLWRRVEFLRPWVAAALGQITDQVDELAWGGYGGADGDGWFLIARVHLPARHVMRRLHRRVMPRVEEEIKPLELRRDRYRGRHIYEWSRMTRDGPRSLVSYAMVGQTMVMASDRELVRSAVDRRPRWRWLWGPRPGSATAIDPAELQVLMEGYDRGEDLYAWFRTAGLPAESDRAADSRWARLAAGLRRILALHIDAVGTDLRITPPTITGRWRLDFARTPGTTSGEQAAFGFARIVPASARTFLAVHGLPIDHPVFRDLRDLLSAAMAFSPLEALGDWTRILKLIPGIGNLPELISSLEGKVAVFSLPLEERERPRHCLLVALDRPAIVATGLRAIPSLLRRLVEKGDYRGQPFLNLRGPLPGEADDILLGVVGGTLVVARSETALRTTVDAVEDKQALDTLEVVRQAERYKTAGVLVEFYSAGEDDAALLDGLDAGSIDLGSVQWLFGDARVQELASGGSYSFCRRTRRGVEVVTCSATGFHWAAATAGLAASVVYRLPINGLLRSGETSELERTAQGYD
jgi:hypothetical protein